MLNSECFRACIVAFLSPQFSPAFPTSSFYEHTQPDLEAAHNDILEELSSRLTPALCSRPLEGRKVHPRAQVRGARGMQQVYELVLLYRLQRRDLSVTEKPQLVTEKEPCSFSSRSRILMKMLLLKKVDTGPSHGPRTWGTVPRVLLLRSISSRPLCTQPVSLGSSVK